MPDRLIGYIMTMSQFDLLFQCSSTSRGAARCTPAASAFNRPPHLGALISDFVGVRYMADGKIRLPR